MRGRFSEAQILGFLREAAAGTPIKELCWNDFVSRAMFRAWKAQYGEANVDQTDRLKQLELENARLKKALAHANRHLQRLRAETRGAARLPARTRNIGYCPPANAVCGASALHDADERLGEASDN